MNRVTALIAEDEAPQRRALLAQLRAAWPALEIVAVCEDGVSALEAVWTERLRLNPGAETLVRTCQAAGLKIVLVSGGFTFFTDRLRDLLQIDHTRSNLLEVDADGRLTGRVLDQDWGDICDGEEKRRTVLALCAQHGIDPRQAIAMGDGANDLPMLGAVGLSVAHHAKPAVRERAMVAIESGGLDRLLEVVRP